jgi:23S rRNA (uridine2552-2'-O)-methyltransferase
MSYKPNDFYAQKARKENFAARSVYKLEEMDKKYKLLKKDFFVIDLGASPGSWMQYTSKIVGDNGIVLGIDLKPIEVKLKNGINILSDLNEVNMQVLFDKYKIEKKADAVVSDMAPNTTSNRFTDQARSFELCMLALDTAKKFLKPRGHFVCKIFDGEDAMTFRDEVKNNFEECYTFRPKSTQASSKEFFVIGKFYKA